MSNRVGMPDKRRGVGRNPACQDREHVADAASIRKPPQQPHSLTCQGPVHKHSISVDRIVTAAALADRPTKKSTRSRAAATWRAAVGWRGVVCAISGWLVLWGTLSAVAQVPAPPQRQPIALVGGTVHTVSGETLDAATVLFDQGKLAAIGAAVELPPNTQTIEVAGKHVYPGLFEAHSQLGLTEIASVPATIDHTETGRNNANVVANVAVNPDSEVIPVTRSAGVLLALTAPQGGLISGQSSVLQLDGWTYEDMTLLARAGLHINWPSQDRGRRRRGPPRPDEETGPSPTAQIEELREWFAQARRYAQLRQAPEAQQPFDLRLEALARAAHGELPLIVRADQLVDIQAAVAFGVEQKTRTIILGGYDAPLCADLLKKHNVPVIVSAVYRQPLRRGDPYDHAYTLPRRLLDAGIKFCISTTDRSETWNTRTLPLHAGTAVGFGLPSAEALKAITLYPAEILGVADRVGSLEVGKDATLIVTNGDPLETRTEVLAAYIQGRPVDLSNKQLRLYQKYEQKYQQPGHIPGE